MKTATAKTYREAARRIAEGENGRCCFAVGYALGLYDDANSDHAPLFYEFYYEDADSCCNWWIKISDFPDTQHYRVIALLLAAEIFDSEARGEYAYDIVETK